MKNLLLIDANALIHRSFHALPPFTSKDGKPSGAIYGLSSILLKILRNNPPRYIIALFDRPEATFRKELYNEYKIHRPKTPDELASQIIEARNLFDKFGIKHYEAAGYEADDLIGAATKKFKKTPDLKITVLTGDLDTLQLVDNDKVVVETLKKGISETIIYNETAVVQRYGILPEQIPDYKGLVGDASDNIPGVKSIGPKTAAVLIKEYGTLENFFRTHENSKGKPEKGFEKILESKDIALLSKRLALIHLEAPLEIKNLAEAEYKKIPYERISEYFADLGFQSLLKRISQTETEKKPEKNKIRPSSQANLFENLPTLSRQIIDEIETPLSPILKELEENGIKIDIKKLEAREKELNQRLNELTQKIYAEAGEVFNINSPKQLLDILTKKFRIKLKSTAYEKLISHKGKLALIDLILDYRELFKLKSTYLDPFIELTRKNSRIHPTFIQLKAATGRITCENPNLQNIPESIRDIFIAEKNYKLVSFDYSQIELRVLASVAQDREMIDAFKKNLDIHQITAGKIFHANPDEITSDMRRIAKTLNFGMVYGMGARAFSQQSGLSQDEAKKFISEYFKDFPTIRDWQNEIINQARQDGFVKNLNGRIRYLPEIVSFNPRVQAEAERMAVNFPIQSLAADILKLAMVKTKEVLVKNNFWDTKAKMLLTIHDELIFEIKDDDSLKKIVDLIRDTMESVYKLKIPLQINVGIGSNWKEI